MKEKIIILFILFASSSQALNIDLQAKFIKPGFFDNETAVLSMNITNNELTFSLNNATLIASFNKTNMSIALGDIIAGQTVQKTIDFGKLPAGTYPITLFIQYNLFGTQDSTPPQYMDLVVKPSVPITMKTYDIYIASVEIPSNITVGNAFTVNFNINSSTDSGQVTFNFNQNPETIDVRTGFQSFARTYKAEQVGVYTLEVKTYKKTNSGLILEDYRQLNLLASNPKEYTPIQNLSLQLEQGVPNITTGGNGGGDLVKGVSCFISGCKMDAYAPQLLDPKMEKEGGNFVFSITADDTTTGNSTITGCQIKIGDNPWASMEAADGSYDSPVETAIFSINSFNEGAVDFACSDAAGNIAYSSFFAKQESGNLTIIVMDSDTSQAIQDAVVSIDNVAKGTTNEKGVFQLTLKEGTYNVKVELRGYGTAIENAEISGGKTTQLEINMTVHYEKKFTPPAGLEAYVDASQTAYVNIHPNEQQLMKYSSLILTGQSEEDAVKGLKGGNGSNTGVGKYIKEYDYSCLENPRPSTCSAWHDSDYKIIEAGKGVCADWAGLSVSFSDSYGVPARWVTLGVFKSGWYHAFLEVYLPNKGWTHLDTLWEAYDNPCIYKSQLKCITASASNADGSTTDRTDYYRCGLPLCNESTAGAFATSSASKDMIRALPLLEEFDYDISIINRTTINVTFLTVLSSNESTAIRASHNVTEMEMPWYLKQDFEGMGGTIGQTSSLLLNLNDSNKPVEQGVNFLVTFENISVFNYSFVDSQYSKTLVEISTYKQPAFVSPTPDQRNQTDFKWVFDTPGEHDIKISFAEPQFVFITANDVVLHSIAASAAKRINGSVYAVSDFGNALSDIKNKNSTVYLFGEYYDITSDQERNITAAGAGITRFRGDDVDISSTIALLFWQNSTEVVIGDVRDFDSVNLATSYSENKTIPLLLTEEDELSNVTKESIQRLNATRLYLIDPNGKVSQAAQNELKSMGQVIYISTPANQSFSLVNVSSKSIVNAESGSNTSLIILLLLVVIGGIGVVLILRRYKKL
jgi:hypothetical protein